MYISVSLVLVVVAGLGGRDVNPGLFTANPWWAAAHNADDHAIAAALFCTFAANGVQNRAVCYAKDIDGRVVDQFEITSLTT